jgi:hypothetical protein
LDDDLDPLVSAEMVFQRFVQTGRQRARDQAVDQALGLSRRSAPAIRSAA